METDLNIEEFIEPCIFSNQQIRQISRSRYEDDLSAVPDEGEINAVQMHDNKRVPCFSKIKCGGIHKLNSLIVRASYGVASISSNANLPTPNLVKPCYFEENSSVELPLFKTFQINKCIPTYRLSFAGIELSQNKHAKSHNADQQILGLFSSKIFVRRGVIYYTWENKDAMLKDSVLKIFPINSSNPEIVVNFKIIQASIHLYHKNVVCTIK